MLEVKWENIFMMNHNAIQLIFIDGLKILANILKIFHSRLLCVNMGIVEIMTMNIMKCKGCIIYFLLPVGSFWVIGSRSNICQ